MNTNCETILKTSTNNGGYKAIILYKYNHPKSFLVHRLVYEAFNGIIPDGMQVNHINEIKTDNSVWNLNLMTPNENSNWVHVIKRKRLNGKTSKKVYQYTLEGEFVREYPSTRECGRNGFCQSSVAACCRGEINHHKNYIFKY